jgi:CUG-BP- and ETR3-like factor
VHWETGEVRKQVPPLGSIIYSPDGTKETITKEKYLNDLAAFNSKKTGPPGSNLFVFHLPNDHSY